MPALLPPLAMSDAADRGLIDSVESCQRGLGLSSEAPFADDHHIHLSELGVGLVCAPGGPSFVGHVDHVFALCADEQMIWPHARRVVTPMKNVLPWWNRPDEQLIADAVGVRPLALAVPYLSVAESRASADPGPATCIVTSVDLGPERVVI